MKYVIKVPILAIFYLFLFKFLTCRKILYNETKTDANEKTIV